jgi:hypothetical protein
VRPLTTVVVVLALAVGTGIWWLFFRGPSSADCAPVRELLSFNKTRIEAMNAKTHYPEAGSYQTATEPSEFDYQSWTDGLTDRAAKVTAADLAGPAREMAQTGERFARALIDANAASAHTAPGGPAPPAVMAATAFDQQFQAQVTQLSTTCPA